MKKLFIHIDDRSTDFLSAIYRGVPGVVVRDGRIPRQRLAELIQEHDRIVMTGHGSPSGLFGTGQYLIGEHNADLLRDKECIYIWCHASDYVKRHQLSGFSTGMFISEVGEAIYCGLKRTRNMQAEVNYSNEEFASIVHDNIDEPLEILYNQVIELYSPAKINSKVVEYNHRLMRFFP